MVTFNFLSAFLIVFSCFCIIHTVYSENENYISICGFDHINVTSYLKRGNLSCPCTTDNQIQWFYGNLTCDEIMVGDVLYEGKIPKEVDTVYCKTSEPCVAQIQVLDYAIHIENESAISGVGKFFLVVAIASILVGTFCVVKTYRFDIHLYIRDKCNGSANSEYAPLLERTVNKQKKYENYYEKLHDAYISIASGDTELKYVERTFSKILEVNYNYKFFIDNTNILEQLEYSKNLKEVIPYCNRLIVVLTPTYMNNDWCMYCFSEGFRKLVALNIPILAIVSDHVIADEIRETGKLLKPLKTMMIPFVQSDENKIKSLLQIRQFLAPPINKGVKHSFTMNEPILQHAVDMDRTIEEETKYTFPRSQNTTIEEVNKDDDFEYDDEMEDTEIQVKEYKTQKDFYSLTGDTSSF